MSYSIYHYYYYYSMVSANAWLQLTHLISTTESGCEMGVHPWKLVQPNKTLCSIIVCELNMKLTAWDARVHLGMKPTDFSQEMDGKSDHVG